MIADLCIPRDMAWLKYAKTSSSLPPQSEPQQYKLLVFIKIQKSGLQTAAEKNRRLGELVALRVCMSDKIL